jgi:hypothetical protein
MLESAAKQVAAVPDVVEKPNKTGLEPFCLSGNAYRRKHITCVYHGKRSTRLNSMIHHSLGLLNLDTFEDT